jgi:hypothetical protein
MNWGFWVALVGALIALFRGLETFLKWREYYEKKLGENPMLRQEWAQRLRDHGRGGAYRDTLSSALAWLERVFGPPGSWRALGLCFWVAIAYAWVTFFLGWGFFGASGAIGNLNFLPADATDSWRAVFGIMAIALPALSFYLAAWLARRADTIERRWQSHWLGYWPARWNGRWFKAAWLILRMCLAGLVFGAMASATVRLEDKGYQAIFVVIWVFVLPFFIFFIGVWSGKRAGAVFRSPGLSACAAFGLGAVAVAVAVAGAVALIASLAGALGAVWGLSRPEADIPHP